MSFDSKRFRHTVAAVALSTALAVSAAGCAGQSGGDPTTDESKGDLILGASLSLTGPNGATGRGTQAGANARITQENARGGIDGHKVVLEVADDQLAPVLAPAAARKLVEEDKALATRATANPG